MSKKKKPTAKKVSPAKKVVKKKKPTKKVKVVKDEKPKGLTKEGLDKVAEELMEEFNPPTEEKKDFIDFIEIENSKKEIQRIIISDFDVEEDKNELDFDLLKIGICFSTDQAMNLCANFGAHEYYIKTEIINHFKYSKKYHVFKIIYKHDSN
jgi:hypothetical protein